MDVEIIDFVRKNPSPVLSRWESDPSYRAACSRVIAQTQEGRDALLRAALSWRSRPATSYGYGEYRGTDVSAAAWAGIARAGVAWLARGARALRDVVVRHPVAAVVASAAVVEASVAYWRDQRPEFVRLYQAGRDFVLAAAGAATHVVRAAGQGGAAVARLAPVIVLGAVAAALYFVYNNNRRKK